ncbi:MAG: SLC13 family permease [Thermosynechococcaceae cyanobacterium MS004]|nr:SLC13 family permease [Thermosynechococcaceae cyanobacterium MS004]
MSPIALTLGVVVLALVMFVAEWLPVDVTALCIAILLMALGLVTPEEGISGFGNPATITVMAMFILSAGIARTGVIQVVSEWLQKWGGRSARQQILAMGIIVGPITALINNTAVVAVFLPIIEDWCRKRNISPSKLLMPLSFATVLGGMITLIGTSTNILASGLSEKLGYGQFSLFQFTALGLITFGIGMLYLVFIAPILLPDRKPPESAFVGDAYSIRDYVSEVVITPGSSLVGQTLRSSQIQRKFDIDILEIIRGGEHFPQPLADKVLSAGDILLVRGGREDVLKIRDQRGIEILPDVQFGNAEQDMLSTEENVAELLILANSNLIGSSLKDLRFRQRYNATVLAIRRGQDLVRERFGQVPLRFGDLLLVQAPKESFLGLQTSQELLVLEQRDVETLRRDRSWLAVGIVLGVVLTAAFDLLPILVSGLIGAMLMVITGCLKPGELYESVRWDIIFLLAGLFPLEAAMRKSGATEWLADTLVGFGRNLGLSGFWILAFFLVITMLLTEILSNNASVVLMLPIAAETAKSLNLNVYAFMFAVTFAASNSFMTPIGYQTNTMVYGPGGYKFTDFLRVGGPLTLLMAIITPPLIVLLYGLNPR